jgi:hypothetical protein
MQFYESEPHAVAKNSVLRIRDVYPESSIPDPNFFHPGSRVKKIPDPGSAPKNLSIFNPKNCFKALGNMIRDVHPVFQDPGVKKALDPGSAHWSYGGCEFKKGEYPENFSILFINTT